MIPSLIPIRPLHGGWAINRYYQNTYFGRCFFVEYKKDLQNGTMTTNRLIGLYITIQQRKNN